MRNLPLLLATLGLGFLSGCVTVKDKPATVESTTTTEETTVHQQPAVSETRTIRSY